MSDGEFAAWLVDLDGTLYRASPLKVCAGLDVALFGARALPVIKAFRAEHERLREEERAGQTASDGTSPYERQLARAAEKLGRPVEEVAPIVRRWMEERPGRWIRLFRRRALLAEIAAFRANGGRTALVSDYPASSKLAALGAQDLFEVVVSSGERGGPERLKPAPDGYLAAAAALGVEPTRCLVIGDRDDADGEAARAAGMGFRHVR